MKITPAFVEYGIEKFLFQAGTPAETAMAAGPFSGTLSAIHIDARRKPTRAMTRDSRKPILYVMTTESGQPEEHILEEGVCLIGRSSESRVVLHDSLVSRQHAEINFDGKTVTLRGLGGKNPVRVNGRDIQDTEDYQLLNDDRITIGESELRFVFEDAGDKSRRLRVFKNSGDCETRVEDLSLDASAAVFGEKNAGTSEANYKRLSSLYRLTEDILEIGDEETAYDAILAAVTQEIGAERGFLGLLPENREPSPYSLDVVKFWDAEQGDKTETIEMSETILTRIQRDKKAVLVTDVADREDFGHSAIDLKIRSFICAPLTCGERCLGLIYIDTRARLEQFGRSELEFVSAVGRIAGLCLQNLWLQANLQRENERLRSLVSNSGQLIGSSPAMEKVFRLIAKVAPRDTSVLITGENGTGKELVALQIHEQSEKKDQAFVAVNCGAIPPNLVESELFGYEKGAFTGADRTTPGKFELANGGTLFLDEIGDMPIDMQVKILRALQERKFYRVGGKAEIEVDIRILSASNRDLKKAIEDGEFREDLYFRLAVVTVEIPPLRDRGDDIIEIAEHFLGQEGEGIELSGAAGECLRQYPWPGNIRELRNALEQAAILGDGKQISPSDLPPEIGKTGRGKMKFLLKRLAEVEKQYILHALEETGGNKAKTASLLGISRETLYQKIKQFEAS